MGHLFAQADALRLPLPDQSVDLVLGSPPYCDARTYGIGAQRDAREWVDWMLLVTEEALRVSKGLVLWVCAGVTRERNYWPACEGLLWEGWKRGWLCECPCYWHRDGIPGSGGDQWFKKNIEYVLAFKATARLHWSDNLACGHKPIHGPGGKMSNRQASGERIRAFSVQTRRNANGSRDSSNPRRPMPEMSNPGNLISTGNGGGNIGHPIAHENEAPFPEALAEFFLKSFVPPNGIVLDPFSGSGTTVSVSERLGRNGIGFDLRMSQCKLGKQRLERPHAPVVKSHGAEEPMPLFAELT